MHVYIYSTAFALAYLRSLLLAAHVAGCWSRMAYAAHTKGLFCAHEAAALLFSIEQSHQLTKPRLLALTAREQLGIGWACPAVRCCQQMVCSQATVVMLPVGSMHAGVVTLSGFHGFCFLLQQLQTAHSMLNRSG